MLKDYSRGDPLPPHLETLWRRFNPSAKQLEHANPWIGIKIDADPLAVVVATGVDSAGRPQRIYSPDHIAQAKAGKFERVQGLLAEWEDIRTEIEGHINDRSCPPAIHEAAVVAHLIYCTGIRPGSTHDTLGKVQAYGATTLQLRHVKPCSRGVRLKFIGKKGVQQNVLVTDPYLVRSMLKRKRENPNWSTPLFDMSAGTLRGFFSTLGSGAYSPKDFRTARGTSLALELLGSRKRVPKSKAKCRLIVNDCLDRVAKALGNTRAVSRSAYVDPEVLARFLPEGN